MDKSIKLKIEKLNKKADKLTNAMWNEPKGKMYKKICERLININKEIEELRKKYE